MQSVYFEQQFLCIAVLTKVHTRRTLCKWTHAPSKSCIKLHFDWDIKIVNFHFLTEIGIVFDSWPLKMPQGQFRTRLSAEDTYRGVGMLEYGVPQRRVAGILNVSQSDISRMWIRHLTYGDPWNRHGGGRDRATTQRQDRLLLLIQSRRQRFPNATSLNNEFRNGAGACKTIQAVRNRLHEFGLNSRRPALPLPVTRQHLQDRLDFSELTSDELFVTGRQYYSLISPDSVSILLRDVSWCG